ncbi:MAG: hypothetical protein ACRDQ5_19125 [Sciscionella sp.]
MSIDAEPSVESELIDIGTLPLTALRPGESAALRAAMRDILRRAGNAQVCDQNNCNDWTGS